MKDQIKNNLASIKERWQKIKAEQGSRLFWVSTLVLGLFLGFGLYNLAYIYSHREPVRVEMIEGPRPTQNGPAGVVTDGFVASRNGTKYHLPWCPGAVTIKPENIIVFKTKQEAESAGYSPAANCPGI